MGKKILLVDDEPYIVLLVETRLKAEGYEVVSAMDGVEALEKAKKEMPDLIILDLMLPKMDGYKVCGLLKRDARYARIPIVLFTARAQEEDRKLGSEAGADAYLTKPFDPHTLIFKVHELIQNGTVERAQ
jgi:DNA-binding response OmpR family regulator